MDKAAEKGVTYAVIGYVPDDIAKSLESQKYGQALELRAERGSDQEIVRIKPDDIAGVLQGASQGGETGVQVFLKDGATVETASRGVASELFLRPIKDLSSVLISKIHLVAIFVDPVITRDFAVTIRDLQTKAR